YSGGPGTEAQRFEVAVGAVLTQNTSWLNAERAIMNLVAGECLSPAGILGLGRERLASLIRPSGYFNQKAERLLLLADFFSGGERPTREALLAIRGVGPETADSIMLYAYSFPVFVVDAYTRRIFARIGETRPEDGYEQVRERFESRLPRDPALFQEYHALIVELAKRHCLKRPHCDGCPIARHCDKMI
ncbi:MAG TPA: hypothetical protein VLA34_08450, partial [Candidatus Krumholzibacterium sp.]|nr:hypothetical protein [Candidatus Krumholzibacterium sp.]